VRVVIDIPIDEDGAKAVKELLDTLIRIWGRRMQRFPLPPLYRSGIVFEPDPRAGIEEVWRPPYKTFEQGSGDCDQLVLYRGAELWASGETSVSSQCMAQRTPAGTKMHVRVRRANGLVEDPSIILSPGK